MQDYAGSRRLMLKAGAAGIAAALLAPAGRAAAGTVTTRPTIQPVVDDIVRAGATGAQAAASAGRHETLAARAGVADVTSGRLMPIGAPFRIGSNTKTFVAVVVLQLAGEGRLRLDDPVERWLPGVVAGPELDGARITVRQLLQHTSGLSNFTDDLAALASEEGYLAHRLDHYDPAGLVAIAMRHGPLFAPGTHWSYSNTNYVLAGMIVRRVTGRPWAAEVRDRIVRPLGLCDTGYPGDHPSLPPQSARGYQQFTPGGRLVDASEFNATAADAAGGMVSSTADLLRFWRALQRGELLRPAQLHEMRRTRLAETLQEVRPGLRYGLGVFWVPAADGRGGFWGHPGDVPGTSVFNGVDDHGTRAAVVYRTTGLADPAATGALDARAMTFVEEYVTG